VVMFDLTMTLVIHSLIRMLSSVIFKREHS
jgi:hypothetical protein